MLLSISAFSNGELSTKISVKAQLISTVLSSVKEVILESNVPQLSQRRELKPFCKVLVGSNHSTVYIGLKHKRILHTASQLDSYLWSSDNVMPQ